MKKIIFLMMLAIASVSLTSCVNDDGYIEVPDIVNTGQVTYLGKTFPLRNAVITDSELADGGIYYTVELSQNVVPQYGKLNGSYLFLEIFQRNGLLFNGTYDTSNSDRRISYIEYFENPTMDNYVPITGSGSLEVYDNQFQSGNIYLENYFDYYDRSLLNSRFSLRDISGNTLYGDFNGFFDYYSFSNKSSKSSISSKTTNTTKRFSTSRSEMRKQK